MSQGEVALTFGPNAGLALVIGAIILGIVLGGAVAYRVISRGR